MTPPAVPAFCISGSALFKPLLYFGHFALWQIGV
jgi:hypothetical protein